MSLQHQFKIPSRPSKWMLTCMDWRQRLISDGSLIGSGDFFFSCAAVLFSNTKTKDRIPYFLFNFFFF